MAPPDNEALVITVARHGAEIEHLKSQMVAQQTILHDLQADMGDIRVLLERTGNRLAASQVRLLLALLTAIGLAVAILSFVIKFH